MNANETLVRNLKLIRSARQMDAETFAKASGVSQQLLSLWGLNKNSPTLKVIERAATRLGLRPSVLLLEDPADVLRGAQTNGSS